jgi:hypothetical protein
MLTQRGRTRGLKAFFTPPSSRSPAGGGPSSQLTTGVVVDILTIHGARHARKRKESKKVVVGRRTSRTWRTRKTTGRPRRRSRGFLLWENRGGFVTDGLYISHGSRLVIYFDLMSWQQQGRRNRGLSCMHGVKIQLLRNPLE